MVVMVIMQGMNVSQTTQFFSEFGRVGRIFLQPDTRTAAAKEGFRYAQGTRLGFSVPVLVFISSFRFQSTYEDYRRPTSLYWSDSHVPLPPLKIR
jgi:hypothetical protein